MLRPNAKGNIQRIEVQQRPMTAPRSFFFFFIGTDLQKYFNENLRDAVSSIDATTLGDSRIAAFRYNTTDKVWEIAELHYDPASDAGTITTVEQFEEIDRNNPTFITEIIEKMKSYFPATEYGLAFGGHGTGWLPIGSVLMKARLYAGDNYPITRYYGEPGSMFEITEIAESLTATETLFDYIIFDDCFMSNIETLYTLRSNARYIIASPCEVMGKGFPYQYVIPAVMTPNATLEDRLQNVCEKYYNFYLSEYDPYYISGCVAMTDCSQLEYLAETACSLFATSTATCDPTQLQYYEEMSSHLFYDFRQYAEQIATDPRALRLFQEQFDQTFPPECQFHTPSFFSVYVYPYKELTPIKYYSGVTCSAPASRYITENQQTEWWRATHPIGK